MMMKRMRFISERLKKSTYFWISHTKSSYHFRLIHSPHRVPSLKIFQKAVSYAQNGEIPLTAIVSRQGNFTYAKLLHDSELLSKRLSPNEDLGGQRVVLLCEAGYDYVRAQWAVWRSNGIFVPLCTTHPGSELEYVMRDSEASIAISDKHFESVLKPLAEQQKMKYLCLDEVVADATANANAMFREHPHYDPFDINRNAMIIYTSGTTGRPKGVVTTHANIEAQVLTMINPWEWTSRDHILHVLPLHHVHGVINVLTCALWSGAVCEMMPKFDAKTVWQQFMKDDISDRRSLNLFMAVPTIYAKLIEEYDRMPPEQQKLATKACQRFRVMVSGSMALPESIMKRWQVISSGQVLLERYGMTEIGMALSNPLHGERIPGSVGVPLPSVNVKIVDMETEKTVTFGSPGELRIKGPTVFKEYWKRPEATRDAFDKEGFFKTGDIAVLENGRYRILGRSSVDIIKRGGYKISALDIERVLLEHEDIAECAVIGIDDEMWGQQIAAIVALKKGAVGLDLVSLRNWAQPHLAKYKLPDQLIVLDTIPRNAMGKINKKELIQRLCLN